jgi:hypothetical protein
VYPNEAFSRDVDPTAIRSVIYQGLTCLPPNFTAQFLGRSPGCELGGFPAYSVRATTVAQIQLAINFARSLNIRLVIKNTGHDFGGKSTGMGALNIWTHNLKDMKYYPTYKGGSYNGPAVKFGAGVQVFEANAFSKANAITVVGGEGAVSTLMYCILHRFEVTKLMLDCWPCRRIYARWRTLASYIGLGHGG